MKEKHFNPLFGLKLHSIILFSNNRIAFVSHRGKDSGSSRKRWFRVTPSIGALSTDTSSSCTSEWINSELVNGKNAILMYTPKDNKYYMSSFNDPKLIIKPVRILTNADLAAHIMVCGPSPFTLQEAVSPLHYWNAAKYHIDSELKAPQKKHKIMAIHRNPGSNFSQTHEYMTKWLYFMGRGCCSISYDTYLGNTDEPE